MPKRVVARLHAKDVPGHNPFGPVVKDERSARRRDALFPRPADRAHRRDDREPRSAGEEGIKLEMPPLPPIFSIDDAIAANSFSRRERIVRGRWRSRWRERPSTRSKASLDVGGQEHFYLESQIRDRVSGRARRR